MIQSQKRSLMRRFKKILSYAILLLAYNEVSSSIVNDDNGHYESSDLLTEPTGYECQKHILELFMDASIYLTQEAGSFVKNLHTNNKVSVKKKGELRNTRFENGIMDDPITNADKLSNYILLHGFKILFPKLRIVSEEKLDISPWVLSKQSNKNLKTDWPHLKPEEMKEHK